MDARKVAYLNPDGKEISATAYAAMFKAKPEAWALHRYENDRVKATLSAVDRIFNIATIPPEHWMRFELKVWNIVSTDIEGNPLPEPKKYADTDASGKFRTKEEAVAAFERFLAKHTECSYDSDSGKFMEEGNKLAPPNPDKPTIIESSPIAADFGSW